MVSIFEHAEMLFSFIWDFKVHKADVSHASMVKGTVWICPSYIYILKVRSKKDPESEQDIFYSSVESWESGCLA